MQDGLTLQNLHSNMVRFIMKLSVYCRTRLYYIYIPIWLDLLFSTIRRPYSSTANIYIPIWLDLLSKHISL